MHARPSLVGLSSALIRSALVTVSSAHTRGHVDLFSSQTSLKKLRDIVPPLPLGLPASPSFQTKLPGDRSVYTF